MPYNPYIHHRRSIRLKGYDYSWMGCYFVTICTQNRLEIFGDVVDGAMILNKYGKLVKYTWNDLSNHNHNIDLGEYIVMPDHIHGIILINNITRLGNIGAGLEPAPTVRTSKNHGIPEIIRQFKTFSTRRINDIRNSPSMRVWQRNYYERIIRNEKEYLNTIKYIAKNPLSWNSDNIYPVDL